MSNNVETARKAMYELFNDRDLTAVDRYFTEDYTQHTAIVPDGREGLRAIVPTLPDGFRYTMLRLFEDGDYVIALSRISGFSPEGDVAVADIYRFENGRIAEHWDVMQPYVSDDQTVSGNPML